MSTSTLRVGQAWQDPQGVIRTITMIDDGRVYYLRNPAVAGVATWDIHLEAFATEARYWKLANDPRMTVPEGL